MWAGLWAECISSSSWTHWDQEQESAHHLLPLEMTTFPTSSQEDSKDSGVRKHSGQGLA